MKMNNLADNLQKPNTAKKARAEYKRTHLPNSVQVQKEARHGMQTPSQKRRPLKGLSADLMTVLRLHKEHPTKKINKETNDLHVMQSQ